jgi:hypothetical protein
MDCAFCRQKMHIEHKVGRQDTCPHCNRDLRCCRQCNFYDPGAYNGCKEVSAERIVDKERANFCDFFVLKGAAAGRGNFNRAKQAKMALEALFNKGGTQSG